MYDFAVGNALEETGRLPVVLPQPGRIMLPSRHEGPDYGAIQRSREFVSLRRRLRAFVFPMSFVFLAWYLTYVLLAAYAHDFMSRKLFGQVNVGMALGIGQFASTALITVLYLRYAGRHLDPRVAELRARAEDGSAR
jgi:uncharacterized membrane protein (DUF485 family)